jgi:hypothetical protein
MRTSIIATAAGAVLLLAAPGARAAWTLQQGTGSEDTTYLSVGAGSAAVAAAVGIDNSQGNSQSLYAHTLDGDSWAATGFTGFASAVELADAAVGYAGGIIGKVWRTDDGGSSWTEIAAAEIGGTLMDGEAIADIAIADGGATVWIIGATGRCSYSVDSGATWTRVDATLPAGDGIAVTAGEIRGGSIWLVGGVPMTEPDTDGAAGAPASNGFVLRSDDDGASFEAVATGLAYELADVSFVDADRGWAAAATYSAGGGAIGATDDGGATWEFSSLPDLPEDEVAFSGMGAEGTLGACTSAKFFGNDVGVASCTTKTYDADGSNGLFLTTDGGATWTLQAGYKAAFSSQLVAASMIVDTAFPDCHRGWLVGSGKVIARWDNDDAALDCAAGGGADDGDGDGADGGGGSSSSGCGCRAAGSPGAGSLLAALLP